MGIFEFFKSASIESLLNKGDALFEYGAFGPAKQAYEKALAKLDAAGTPTPESDLNQLKAKILRANAALARQHKATAENLLEGGWHDDAVDWLELARELVPGSDLAVEIELLLDRCHNTQTPLAHAMDLDDAPPSPDGSPEAASAYFSVLCAALPEDLKTDYEGYGATFERGYVALNQGKFDVAAAHFQEAAAEQGDVLSHIHLELATAYLNLGELEKSRTLLTAYVSEYPHAVRAYEMLCEIYWEQGKPGQAETLVSNCPDNLKTSVPMMLLMGETLFRQEAFAEAKAFYRDSIRYMGWSEPIATALARTYEALEMPVEALRTYAEIMKTCQGCGQQFNPLVKQRFAELSFEAGDISDGILDLYFALCNEDPANRPRYFRRISKIYARQGYAKEAERYLKFAAAEESDPEEHIRV